MPRRARSGISTGQVLGISIAIIGFLVAAALLFKILAGGITGSGTARSSASSLNLSEYLENANSLRGNVYEVSGKVEELLKWTEDRGRLFSLDVDKESSVPILIPNEFSQTNIDRGMQLTFTVRVDRDGLLVAERIDQG